MTASTKFVNFLLLVSRLLAAWGYEVWHPVDVPLVVCTTNGAPGSVVVEINTTDIPLEKLYKPHILTFYRTSSQATTITYHAVDAHSPVPQVVRGTTTENLQALPRRMATDDSTRKNQDYTSVTSVTAATRDDPLKDLLELEEDELADKEEHEDEDVLDTYLAGRALRRGGGSRSRGGSSSRRSPSPPPYRSPPPPYRSPPPPYRAPPNPGASGARRRGAPSAPSPNTQSGTRAAPVPGASGARRRGAPAETGSRRRIDGPVDGSRYNNPSNPQAGSYSYGSPATMSQNYPSGHQTASYGYTGAQAYKSNSGKNVMLAAGAGLAAGAVAGAGAMYMYSRWNSHGYGYRYNNYQCAYGTTWTGSCRDCYSYYDRCQRALPENAARDDLMNSGFIPADFISPIRVNFTSITGVDFLASRICPPEGWNPDPEQTNVTWTPPPAQDLFLTLTEMLDLEEEDNRAYGVSSAWAPGKDLALQVSSLLLVALHTNFLAFAS